MDRGLFHASIIDSFLIDFYIPFLPLDRTHVKLCVRAELSKYKFEDMAQYEQQHLKYDIEQIADEMIYEPPGINKYATAGCKRVPNLVRNLIVEKNYKLLKDEL